MPDLANCIGKYSKTTEICFSRSKLSTSIIPKTPDGFWAVIQVIADVPKTPKLWNVFRSACIPAPPPESEPAIVNTLGIVFIYLGPSKFFKINTSVRMKRNPFLFKKFSL